MKTLNHFTNAFALLASVITIIGSIIYLTWFIADLNKKVELNAAIQQEQIKQIAEKVDKIYALIPAKDWKKG
jgi:C4-dicarboxylate transporter